ncbi:DNA adenine methylase [Prosthecochloris sp. CIB 2401]|uniref:DNA adenine methylase n=1 Tax=Prosthecochloris sp. CIB 2401 TaxID=1868325 RepID=UPI00080AB0D7|nr:DNA adenine methylase [Prosthecochloris sp. CIB 2401]ANT65974.1 DNA adenine methylase [Prosthecochloris sp. CIB 2401]
MRYCSPLRYPGGKGCIFPFITSIFNENDLIGGAYAEPYAGGGGLALRLLYEEYISYAYINDLDPCIYAFWNSAVNMSVEFCEWIESIPVTVETWHHCKEILQNKDRATEFELGTATFFLNRTNVSGVIKGGIIGGLSQKGKYKLDARFNKEELIKRFKKIGIFRNRIIVSNKDGILFVKDLNELKENILIYLDPPYYEKGQGLYMNAYADEDHKQLSAYVTNMNTPWIISYDNHDFIKKLYSQNRKISHQLSQSTSNRTGREIFIFDNSLKYTSSIKSLKKVELITS